MDKKFWNKQKTVIAVLSFLIIIAAVLSVLSVRGIIGSGDGNDVKGSVAQADATDIPSEQKTLAESTKGTSETGSVSTETVWNTEITEQTSPDSDTETTAADENNTGQTSAAAAYRADFAVVNSWQENGIMCYQFSGTVTNTSSLGISTWNIVKDIGVNAEIRDFWNCTCTVSDSSLVIKPADYNASVAAGASVTDVGFIVSTSGTLTAFSYNGNSTADGSHDSNNEDTYNPPKFENGTPVGNHGQLSVKGTDLVDKNGAKYQLKGVSTHGLQWFPQYVNKEAFKTLRDDWGANVVRLAMYTGENGYCTGGSKSDLEEVVNNGVKAATELGMYVIIDWHILSDGNPNTYKNEAIAFFDKMSKKYGKNINVIYEICNEPNGNVSWDEIKKYADEVIPVIRKNSPNAVILVGTPTWSQDVDRVAANPVASPENVMYTLHFYAAAHKDNIRDKLKTAVAAGTPVFISEFSICDASGNGGIDYDSASAWKSLIESYNISFVGWNLSNKNEASSLIAAGNSKTSGWSLGDLSETGKWLRSFIAGG